MPNAKDFVPNKNSILFIGPSNAGKTTALRTLPGHGFVLFTDPNGPVSLGPLPGKNGLIPGADIEYELFIRDVAVDENGAPVKPQTAKNLRKWFLEAKAKNFFAPFDWIALDNLSFLLDIIEDDYLAYRAESKDGIKRIDNMRDSRPLQRAFKDILGSFRDAAFGDGKDRTLIFIAHEDVERDFVTDKVAHRSIDSWGKLRATIPTYVNHVFYAKVTPVGENMNFQIVTNDSGYGAGPQGTRTRSSWQGLPLQVEATIKDWSKAHEVGLGKLLTDFGGKK